MLFILNLKYIIFIFLLHYMNIKFVNDFPKRPLETLDVEGLVRLWAHEALRLFHDRLVNDEERKWTNENVDAIALKVK